VATPSNTGIVNATRRATNRSTASLLADLPAIARARAVQSPHADVSGVREGSRRWCDAMPRLFGGGSRRTRRLRPIVRGIDGHPAGVGWWRGLHARAVCSMPALQGAHTQSASDATEAYAGQLHLAIATRRPRHRLPILSRHPVG